jgi:hypothetical protein
MKHVLEQKLAEALKEIRTRSCERSSSVGDIQRMYGVILGLRIAIMEANKLEKAPQYEFAGAEAVHRMMDANFGKMSRGELKAFFA